MTGTGWAGWLHDRLGERDWHPATLARRSEGQITTGEISKWLSGKVTPRIPSIRIVCDVLEVPPVEGMLAAGHLQPADLEVTVVERTARATALADDELLAEIARRLERGRAARSDLGHTDVSDNQTHLVVDPTPLRPAPAGTRTVDGVLGEDYAARRARPDRQD